MSKKDYISLVCKFKVDITKRSRTMRFLLVFDQMLNVLIWNGSQDETISSHIGRKQLQGTATWFDNKICCLLSKLEHNHCNKSLGE
jgi:hypothetical protein